MNHHMKNIALGAALAAAAGGVGCGSDDNGPLQGVDSLIILQRPKRNDEIGRASCRERVFRSV